MVSLLLNDVVMSLHADVTTQDCVTASNLSTTICDPGPVLSRGYICRNSQKYIVWIKIIDFSFMPKIIRISRSCSM